MTRSGVRGWVIAEYDVVVGMVGGGWDLSRVN